MSITPLLTHLQQVRSLTEEELAALAAVIQERRIRRRQYLLQEGDVCQTYHFVVEGCFRMFHVDAKGTEHVIQFAAEDGWIADIGSFHSERPSRFYIEALEPGHVLQIRKPDLIDLYTNFPVFDRYFRVLVENAFVGLQNRMVQQISASAEARYQHFLEIYPHLQQRISQVQIAAYIGITPEFLSKLRRDMRNS